MIYKWIGKAVVALSSKYAKRKVTTRKGAIALGVGAAILGVGAAAYLSGRDVPEG